jgi:hypothetical protein
MLRIKQVSTYSVAQYPEAEFRPWKEGLAASIMRSATVSTALLFILESCDGTGVGTTGPPPVIPEMLTENEARETITRIFNDNGIPMVPDVPLKLVDSNNDTIDVLIDGYNESFRVGYEYIADGDDFPYTAALHQGIDAGNEGSGPYIGLTHDEYLESNLERQMQAFIDTLKAQGKI